MIVERGYLDHWKTNLLRSLTSSPTAAELPLRLWEHCEARMDDFIEDRDGLVICGICRWPGEPKVLLDALIRCRWIEKKTGGYLIRGWRDRQRGKFANRLNGMRGGRPKKERPEKPNENPRVSNSEPNQNPDIQNPNPRGGERRGEEKSREPADSPRASARMGARASESELLETWSLILSVLGAKKRAAGCAVMNALSDQAEHLPLPADRAAMLHWFYALPADPQDVDLRSRYRNADRLALNLFAAVESAEAYAKKIGHAEKKEAAPEPAGWRQAMAAVFPGGEIPDSWEEFQRLGASIRQPVLARLHPGGAA